MIIKHDRRGIAASRLFPSRLPDDFSGLLIECDQKTVDVVIFIQNHFIPNQHRGT